MRKHQFISDARDEAMRISKKEGVECFFAMNELIKLGFNPTFHTAEKYIEFEFKNSLVRFFPFTGWATGKAIKDGRGLQNLLKQIKNK